MKKHNFWLLNLATLLFFFSACTKQELSESDLANAGISSSKGGNSNLSTDGITDLTLTSAKVKGTNLNQVQKNAVLGICWSATNPDPTVADNVVFTTAVEGAFTVPMNNLEPLSIYYVRVFFASNEVSPGKYANLRYGNVIDFETTSTEPVFLSWSNPNRNSVWNDNKGIRWDGVTPGIVETYANQRIRPGLELVARIPNPGGDGWIIGVNKLSALGVAFDFNVEVNYEYFIGENGFYTQPTGKYASVNELVKLKYVGQTMTIERSADNGATWEILGTASTFVPTGSYYVGFWSKGGGPDEIYLRLAQ